jgi:hypothetical protein
MYSTLTILQRKRYLFVCINRRAEDNPKNICSPFALKTDFAMYTDPTADIAPTVI